VSRDGALFCWTCSSNLEDLQVVGQDASQEGNYQQVVTIII